MFFLRDGQIIPGVGINRLELGMHKKEVENIISTPVIRNLPEHIIYEGGDVKVWISKNTEIVTQILVFGTFSGKLKGNFGIGSHLADIEKKLNMKAKEEHYVYSFDEIKGICFELGEVEEDWDDFKWFKENAPIEAISVFESED